MSGQFGTAIRTKRHEEDWTMGDVADLFDLNSATISNWENQDRIPHRRNWEPIRGWLGISQAEMYQLMIGDNSV